MTRTVTLLILLRFLNCLSQDTSTSILLSDITIISADEKSVKSTIGHVLLKNKKIVYAGTEKPEVIGVHKKIDGKGKYLIPGLIDQHVHFANTAGLNGPLKKKHPEVVELYFNHLPKSYRYFGFTTFIDVNNYWPERINEVLKAEIRPDIYTCGEQVTVMDDFNMEMEEYS